MSVLDNINEAIDLIQKGQETYPTHINLRKTKEDTLFLLTKKFLNIITKLLIKPFLWLLMMKN